MCKNDISSSESQDHSTSSTGKTRSETAPSSSSAVYEDSNTFSYLNDPKKQSEQLELAFAQNNNTEWLHGGFYLLLFYVSVVVMIQLVLMALVPFKYYHLTWTMTAVIHGILSMVILHWIKGSPGEIDAHGEMNAMTLWEQMDSDTFDETRYISQKQALVTVPTLLCLLALNFGSFVPNLCLVNMVVWTICVIPKLPFMTGVRILGMNRTAGIDDMNYMKTRT
eukprot:CAMPEP_0178972298 /NCGR_PEP_ID=MMETSP0789-20121207/20913_1 /TAXON_ID=3005 /ORGANISM="Rhizosolenia setigera, Strain CCMP 1694" /LENGTH=222 /DNA_ID=CAMNT_0020659685 /DNA_START=128 /DNA_END=796 /DNA_ORIENTATION=+